MRTNDARIAVLEQIAKETHETLMRLETRMDRLDAKLDTGFAHLDAKIDANRDKQERDFRLLFSALIAVAIGLAALVAHSFKWF